MVLSDIKLTMLDFFGDYKSYRASKLHDWFKSYVNSAKWVDVVYLLSCIRKSLNLKPVQKANFLFILREKSLELK